jgi:hypothetical protein
MNWTDAAKRPLSELNRLSFLKGIRSADDLPLVRDDSSDELAERKAMNWTEHFRTRRMAKFHKTKLAIPGVEGARVRSLGSFTTIAGNPDEVSQEHLRTRRMAKFHKPELAIPGVEGARVRSFGSFTTIAGNPDTVSQTSGESSCDELSEDELSLQENGPRPGYTLPRAAWSQ